MVDSNLTVRLTYLAADSCYTYNVNSKSGRCYMSHILVLYYSKFDKGKTGMACKHYQHYISNLIFHISYCVRCMLLSCQKSPIEAQLWVDIWSSEMVTWLLTSSDGHFHAIIPYRFYHTLVYWVQRLISYVTFNRLAICINK